MPTKLSQDLSDDYKVDTIDILWDDEETTEETEETKEAPAEKTEETKEESKEETTEDKTKETPPAKEETSKESKEESVEEILSLDEIIGDTKEIKEDIGEVTDKTEEMKETIEDAKDAIQEDDKNSAEKLIDDLYKQVIEYSTKVDTLTAKNDVLQGKLVELTKSNSDFELEIAQSAWKSNDPKMLVLNRMYDWAIAWEDFSKTKVISTLEDMYYWLTGKSFDESRIDKVSDSNAEEVVLNEITPPAIEEETKEEVDLNDISSIF